MQGNWEKKKYPVIFNQIENVPRADRIFGDVFPLLYGRWWRIIPLKIIYQADTQC